MKWTPRKVGCYWDSDVWGFHIGTYKQGSESGYWLTRNFVELGRTDTLEQAQQMAQDLVDSW